MREYIDVRGPHPIYFRGSHYVRLIGCKRDISIQGAKVWGLGNRVRAAYDYVNHVDRRQGKL